VEEGGVPPVVVVVRWGCAGRLGRRRRRRLLIS
jgi:hypothetical protein